MPNSTETFDSELVRVKIEEFNTNCKDFIESVREIDEEVNEVVQKLASQTLYCEVGEKLLKIWEDNCSIFTNYDLVFQDWSSKLEKISANNAQVSSETVSIYGSGSSFGPNLLGGHDSGFRTPFASLEDDDDYFRDNFNNFNGDR